MSENFFIITLRLGGKYFLSCQLAAVIETELLPKLGTQIREPSKATENGPFVDREGLKLLKVHVNRMLPSAGVVLEHPLLNGVALDPEAGSLVAAAYQLFVHLPHTACASPL